MSMLGKAELRMSKEELGLVERYDYALLARIGDGRERAGSGWTIWQCWAWLGQGSKGKRQGWQSGLSVQGLAGLRMRGRREEARPRRIWRLPPQRGRLRPGGGLWRSSRRLSRASQQGQVPTWHALRPSTRRVAVQT